MKANPIIKKTLQSKQTKKEKLAYLVYAYKEWLVGGVIIIGIAALFLYSFTRPKEEVYNLAIISESALADESQPKLSETVKNQYAKQQKVSEKAIRVDFVSYEEPAAVQAFTTRLAAGDIQAIVFEKAEEKDWTERFGTQALPLEKITVGDHDYFLQITNKKTNSKNS